MKEQIQKTYSNIAEAISETVQGLKDSAKEKSQAFIDEWLNVLPELEKMGFEMTSFGVVLGISPALQVELQGTASDFDESKLDHLMSEYNGNKYVTLVLKSIRTTRKMHQRVGKDVMHGNIYLKLNVKVPPEVSVYFGRPYIL